MIDYKIFLDANVAGFLAVKANEIVHYQLYPEFQYLEDYNFFFSFVSSSGMNDSLISYSMFLINMKDRKTVDITRQKNLLNVVIEHFREINEAIKDVESLSEVDMVVDWFKIEE